MEEINDENECITEESETNTSLEGAWKEIVNSNREPPVPATTTTATARSVTRSTRTTKSDGWTQLQNLESLYEKGYITATEYSQRKSQIIDTMTGTKSVPRTPRTATYRKNAAAHTVINEPPPDFSKFPSEKAMKYIFNVKRGKWSQEMVTVKMAPEPFARGGLRKAYHLLDLTLAEKFPDVSYVGKLSMDPFEDKEIYFQDVEMQMYAREWAEKFNSYNPPKTVNFVKAWLIELIERPDRPICGVERYIAGPYRKHNNNFGYVSDLERNTPQAFSHFTFEASGGQILLCDIQGVNDLYTDPQIHNRDGIGFGKGNMGEKGFEKFLATHHCNHICRYLKLPPVNPKYQDCGTKAATTIMSYKKVDIVQVQYPSNNPYSYGGKDMGQQPAKNHSTKTKKKKTVRFAKDGRGAHQSLPHLDEGLSETQSLIRSRNAQLRSHYQQPQPQSEPPLPHLSQNSESACAFCVLY
eukprot:CAMPEP_0174264422 /NCGR_PEP_ID=MMETSP0439-20130205/22408_1 /TAXON_ID=0 /ORGANISM="Stereomyxa ramosa, Strain Chinc5" /LENGTH=467 /DNA_ID=CAMNT_0015350281 /DNA_START=60 /DNA_END=1463 /DNA_ORIENTATION=-